MKIRIVTHANCFDGAASAALFSEFLRLEISPGASFTYLGLSYVGGPIYTEAVFDPEADTHAVVDLKYCADPRVEWWFDHHEKGAFDSPDDEARFRSDRSGKRFYDPSYKSCVKLIADTLKDRFGYDSSGMAELIAWGNKIDGALYDSVEDACDMTGPAAILHAVVENTTDAGLLDRVIRLMRSGTLAEAAADPSVAEAFHPLLAAHQASLAAIREHARIDKGVIWFDLSESPVEKYHKFAPFLLADVPYNLSVTRQKGKYKLSLGFNRFSGRENSHHLGALCERFGGGGHKGVGAARFDEVEAARRAMSEVLAVLTS